MSRLDGLHHQLVALPVQSGSDLIEHEEHGFAQEGPGEADALALSLRESDRPVPELRVEPLGKAARPFAEADSLQLWPQRVVLQVRTQPAQVVPQRAAKERGLLADQRDVPSPRFRRELRQRHTVDADGAGLGALEPEEQVDESGLADARRSHHDHGLSGHDLQIESLEHGSGPVGEVDTLEGHRTLERPFGVTGPTDRLGVGLHVEQLEHTGDGRRGALQVQVGPGEPLERAVQPLLEHAERHQIAEAHLPGVHEVHASDHHREQVGDHQQAERAG